MKYQHDEAICMQCIEDKFLRELVFEKNKNQTCIECGKNNYSISIKELAEYIDTFIREHFRHGTYERRFNIEHDGYWDEQGGEDLISIISIICGQDFKCVDDIAQILIEQDVYDVRDGEDPFYGLDIGYEEKEIYLDDIHNSWQQIENEIKTKRRFFSNRAQEFFEWLFDDIEHLHIYDHQSDPTERRKSVIYELPVDTLLFRARRADTLEICKQYIDSAVKNISPPPAKYAKEGRMNAKGVSIFYAATEKETCIAEMRTSIGSFVVLGQFKTEEPIRILDFSYFEKAFWKNSLLSYFQDDFEEQVKRRKFLKEIHRLISKPIISGYEDGYLMTQALAEYIAYVYPKNIDGLLFKSTQHDKGSNIVIFSKKNNRWRNNQEGFSIFPVELVSNSLEIHKIVGIAYDAKKINFSNSDNNFYIERDYDEDY